MPLRDHFRPPLDELHSWDVVHGQWPAMIVLELNRILPKGFVAGPRIYLGSRFEVDIGSFERDDRPTNVTPFPTSNDTEVAWDRLLTLETEPDEPSEYEVLVYDMTRRRRLVAAIEIVSPANKDRPEHRRDFAVKCASLLNKQVSVIIVDIVTIRRANLYLELLELIGQHDAETETELPTLYAVACRNRWTNEKKYLDALRHSLTVGQPLPTLPLWLTEDLSIPLNLEQSYEATCQALRID